jgi:two-component system, cell cycle response regulator
LLTLLEAARIECTPAEDLTTLAALLVPDGGRVCPSALIGDCDIRGDLAFNAFAFASSLGEGRPYVLAVASQLDEKVLQRALAAGADDFLVEPLTPAAIGLRLAVGEKLWHLRDRISSINTHLRFVATHDLLTGVWNKSSVVGHLYRESVRAVRQSTNLVVLMCDIDHFKDVNDRLGHVAGDDVLRQVASRLQSMLRPYDLVGRYGGEEFLVLLPGCSAAEGAEIANRILGRVRDEPVSAAGHKVMVTMSIGLAALIDTGRTDQPLSPMRVLELADETMYVAKANGRNRLVSADQ